MRLEGDAAMTKKPLRVTATSQRIFIAWTAAAFLLAGCAGLGQAGRPEATSTAQVLACGELAGGGSVRPFEDGKPGVTKSELRAIHLASYDRHEDQLRPNEKVGVRYSVAADPGTSRAFFERQIHCYRATRAGTDPRDPLLVPAARVDVTPGVGGYFVDVTSEDREVVEDVMVAAGS
jgi:hypothetical protein